EGRIDLKDLERKLSEGEVKLVAVTGASNVTGFMPDIHAIAQLAHEYGAKILVDAAQLAAHAPIDVKPNNHPEHIDFLVFGGHKRYNPAGGGILFAPAPLSDSANPFMPGGGTISAVTHKKAYFVSGPERHEGGTQDIDALAGGLRGVLVGLKRVGLENVRKHESKLTRLLLTELKKIRGVKIYGDFDERERVGVVSFNVEGMDYETLARKINDAGIQVREGCFCAHPYVHKLLGVSQKEGERLAKALGSGENAKKPGMVRVSIAIHTTPQEIKRFTAAIREIARKPQ
ncbi:MAG: aminotransferase class V-fold PLP-dependent enzyme, partial [Candidatus Micrarchaeota archaeon]